MEPWPLSRVVFVIKMLKQERGNQVLPNHNTWGTI